MDARWCYDQVTVCPNIYSRNHTCTASDRFLAPVVVVDSTATSKYRCSLRQLPVLGFPLPETLGTIYIVVINIHYDQATRCAAGCDTYTCLWVLRPFSLNGFRISSSRALPSVLKRSFSTWDTRKHSQPVLCIFESVLQYSVICFILLHLISRLSSEHI